MNRHEENADNMRHISILFATKIQPCWYIIFSLFFLPFFFSRVTWGMENAYIALPLGWAQVLVAIWGITAALMTSGRRGWVILTCIFFLILFLIHCVQALFLQTIWNSEINQYFAKGVILWGYLAACAIFAAALPLRCVDLMLRIFRYYGLATISIGFMCLVVFLLTGTALLINYYEGYNLIRAQAFMSEPSAWAPIVAFLCLMGIWHRDRVALIFGVMGLILSLSPIVFLVTGLSQLTILMLRVKAIRFPSFLVIIGLMVIVLSIDCNNFLFDGHHPLENLLGRSVCGMQTVFSENARDSFTNDRLISTIAVLQHITDTHTWWSGLGLNSTAIFMPKYYDGLRDNSLWISLLAFYGVWGLVFFLVIGFIGFISIRRGNKILGFIWISFFWTVSVNSAEGFYTYALYFIFWILLLRSLPRRRILINGLSIRVSENVWN